MISTEQAFGQCSAQVSYQETDLTIQFADASVIMDGDSIISYTWSFGDGATSNEENPFHFYASPGNYEIVLIIMTEMGCTDIVQEFIQICDLEMSINSDFDCDADNNFSLALSITDRYLSVDHVDVYLDGTIMNSGISIDTIASIIYNIEGDGLLHEFEVRSVVDSLCTNTLSVIFPDCLSDCNIGGLTIEPSNGVKHIVEVRDTSFLNKSSIIEVGDIVEFRWYADALSSTSVERDDIDQWDTGLRDSGYVFPLYLSNPGIHPFYSVADSGSDSLGMSGVIIVNCPATGELPLSISFSANNFSDQGFNLFVDGVQINDTAYVYADTPTQTLNYTLLGDGGEHLFEIRDIQNPSCKLTGTFLSPDCGIVPTCSMSVSATQISNCNADSTVNVQLLVNSNNTTKTGIEVFVDSAYVFTILNGNKDQHTMDIMLPGDGMEHSIIIRDFTDTTCTFETFITTTSCDIPCSFNELELFTGVSNSFIVDAIEFEFLPKDITISDGDRVLWQIRGDSTHTVTSDATIGPYSWDSGPRTTGTTYFSPILGVGVHPYYSAPYGGPDGEGMSGTITVSPECDNDEVVVNFGFVSEGVSNNGYNVYVDGVLSPSSPFTYSIDGLNSGLIKAIGDGQSHEVIIEDVNNNACTLSNMVVTPDCNASTCQLFMTAQELAPCQNDNSIPYEIFITDIGGGLSGFNLTIDGVLTDNSPYLYAGSGTQSVIVILEGNGQNYEIVALDIDDPLCTDTLIIATEICNNCFFTGIGISPSLDTDLEVICNDSIALMDVSFSVDFASSDSFVVLLDSMIIDTMPYNSLDIQFYSLSLLGDSLQHHIEITDLADTTCGISTFFNVPYCEVLNCEDLITSAILNPCVSLDSFMLRLNLSELNEADSLLVAIDSTLEETTFSISDLSNGITLAGDGNMHTIIVSQIGDRFCTDSISILYPLCDLPCNLDVSVMVTDSCMGLDRSEFVVEILDVGSPDSLVVSGPDIGNNMMLDSLQLTLSNTIDTFLFYIWEVSDPSCRDTLEIISPKCIIPCSITIDSLVATNQVNPCPNGMVSFNAFVEAVMPGESGINIIIDSNVVNTITVIDTSHFTVAVIFPADGMEHILVIQDIDEPLCLDSLVFTTEICQDPCDTYEADFDFNIIEGTLEVFYSDESPEGTNNWFWQFGNGNASVVQNPQIVFAEKDNYTTCLTAKNTNLGCQDSICQLIQLNPFICNPSFTVSTEGYQIHVINTSITSEQEATYEWSLPGNITITEVDTFDFDFIDPGVYEICLIVSGTNCIDTICQTIDLSDPCLEAFADFSYTSEGGTFFFDDMSSLGDVYFWDFTNGDTSDEENPVHTFAASGNYTVCHIVTDTITPCTSMLCKDINVIISNTDNYSINDEITLYPNPSLQGNQQVTLEGRFEKIDDLIITSLNGKEFTRSYTNSKSGSVQLDVSELKPGIYLIRLMTKGKYYFKKLIVL